MSAAPPSMMTVQAPVSASSTTASPCLPAGHVELGGDLAGRVLELEGAGAVGLVLELELDLLALVGGRRVEPGQAAVVDRQLELAVVARAELLASLPALAPVTVIFWRIPSPFWPGLQATS